MVTSLARTRLSPTFAGNIMAVSLDLIEDAWLLESPRAIAEVVRSHSADIFYGAAFWLFYCDVSVQQNAMVPSVS